MADKPKAKFALGDYVEVSERIAAWFDAYPDGRIETDIVSMTDKLVVTRSRCYRSADVSEAPAGIGHSMLGIPGKTPYTRDSELENCETSSVGRALVMAGIPSKNIASGHEIRNKRHEPEQERPKANGKPEPAEHDAVRKVQDDQQIVELLTKVKQHAGYPEALTNLKAEGLKIYETANGYLKGRIKAEFGPAIKAELAKLEPQTV
jgi:hypothetical protein